MTMPAMPGPGESIQRLQTVYRVYTDQHGRQWEAQSDIRNNRPKEEMRPLGCIPPWWPPMRFIWWDGDNQLTFRWAYRQLANDLSSYTATWYSNARKMAVKEHLPVPEVGGDVHQLIRDVFGNPGLSPEIPLSAELGDPWILYGDEHAPRNPALYSVLNQGIQMQSNEALDIIERRVRERMGLEMNDTPNEAPITMASVTEALQQGPPIRKTIKPIGPPVAPVAPAKARAATPGKMPTYGEFFAEMRAQKMPVAEIAIAWNAHKAALKESA
jgi:hypothetical protein